MRIKRWSIALMGAGTAAALLIPAAGAMAAPMGFYDRPGVSGRYDRPGVSGRYDRGDRGNWRFDAGRRERRREWAHERARERNWRHHHRRPFFWFGGRWDR